MKKKVFLSITAMAVALVTSLFVPTQVYATSVTTTTEVVGVGRTEQEAQNVAQVLGARRSSINGEGVNISTISDKDVLKTLIDLELFAKLISEHTKTEVKASELTLLDSMEVTAAPGTTVSDSNPLFVSFSFAGIKADTEAYVFHYSNGAWKIVPTTVSEGKVTGEFSSLSPVAIVTRTSSLKGAVKGANRKKSPRTGDNRYLIIAVCGASLALAGYAASKKKFS